jgi:hypothetical protein
VRWDAVDISRVTDDGQISEQWGAFTLSWAG